MGEIPDVNPVWKECYRVLRTNGVLLASFYNPILFVFDKDIDMDSLNQDQIQEKINKGEAIVFGHSLTDQINGQLAAGFKLTGFYEDEHPSPRFLIEKYMPTMIATKAEKNNL